MDSDYEYEESTYEDQSIIPFSETDSQTSSLNTSLYNKEDFKLELDKDSKIYIFKNSLFTRTLLAIKPNTEREMLIQCTR
jgi:hypothetical protein